MACIRGYKLKVRLKRGDYNFISTGYISERERERERELKPDEMFKIVVQPIAFKKEHLPAVPFLSPLSTYFLHLCDITELASKLKIGGRDRRERERIRDESAPLLSLFLFSQRTFSSVFSSEKKERKGTLSRDNRSLSLSVKRSMNKRVFFPFFISFVIGRKEKEREGARFFSSNSLRGVYITRDQLALLTTTLYYSTTRR